MKNNTMETKLCYSNFSLKYPLVKLMTIDDVIYAFDGKSRLLTEINEEQLLRICNCHENLNINDVPEYIKNLCRRGVFSPGGLKKLVPSLSETDKIVDNELKNQIPRRFILEITEKCTLRCKYCFYTTSNKRKHTNESISINTAIKAIDFYHLRYTSAMKNVPISNRIEAYKENPPNMSWWGGEPFADFELIKETKEYFESLNWAVDGIDDIQIIYGIVTNLTILNDEIIKFIVENNVHLQISLDGDEESHNKNRVFINGGGSFEQVFTNLEWLINLYPIYARNNITIQSVIADNIKKEDASKFIVDYYKIYDEGTKVLAWSPSPERHDYEFMPRSPVGNKDIIIGNFRKNLKRISTQLENSMDLVFIQNKTIYRELQGLLILEEQLVFENPKGKEKFSKTFSCPLGTDTIFVSKNGNIHCCCKVDQSFPLGNVDSGLNRDNIIDIYNKYFKQINSKCKNCWAFVFCKICPALTYWGGHFFLPNESECEEIRLQTEISLLKYIVFRKEFETLYSSEKRVIDFRFDSKPTSITKYQ